MYLTFVWLYLLFIPPNIVVGPAVGSHCSTLCYKGKLLHNAAAPDLHHYVKWQNGILTQMYQGLFL